MHTDCWLYESMVVGAHIAYTNLRCRSLHSLRGRPLPHKRPTLRWPLLDTSCRLLSGDVLQHGPCVVVEDVLEGIIRDTATLIFYYERRVPCKSVLTVNL